PRARRAGAPPGPSRSPPFSLRERHDAVRRDAVPLLLVAVRPADLDAHDPRVATQPEVHAQVVLREVAAAAADLVHEREIPGDDADPGADRAPVRRRARELHREPVMVRPALGPEDVRAGVDVVDDDVDVAV